MLVQELYNKVLALIDNYTEEGVLVSEEENIDVQKKFLLFVDMAQKELWKQNKKTESITITAKPPENKIISTSGPEDFTGEDIYYPDESGIDHIQGFSIQVNEAAADNATIVPVSYTHLRAHETF